jgi:proline iminopeptidase
VSDRYLSLCELLSKDFKCILVDQRGTGKSMPNPKDESTVTMALTLDDFEAIRNQLNLKTWNVLGFSYGGYLASTYAAFFPASIKSMVLLNSSGFNNDYAGYFSDNITSRMLPQDMWVYNYWADPARMNANKQHAITEIIRSMMPGYFFDRKKSLIVSQIIKDTDFDFETGELIEKDIAKRELDLSKMKAVFKGPVLILHGRQDPLGESIPQELFRYYKKTTLIFIEKAGHYSWIEQPERVLTEIALFLHSVQ